MRLVFSLIVLLGMGLAAPVVAQPLNQQPLYGNQPKPPAMIAADETFIANALKLGTRAEGSDKSVALGWRYFFERKDIATAMMRFNQAWLLDPDNGDAFHGFAILVAERDKDAARAEALFQQGIAKPRQSPGIWLDYGRFLLTAKRAADAVTPLRKAAGFSTMGPDVQALLVIALFESGDPVAACTESAKALDGAQPPLRETIRQVREKACGA